MKPLPTTLPSDGSPPLAATINCRHDERLTPLEEYMLADDSRRYPRTFVVTLEFSGGMVHGNQFPAVVEHRTPRAARCRRRQVVQHAIA